MSDSKNPSSFIYHFHRLCELVDFYSLVAEITLIAIRNKFSKDDHDFTKYVIGSKLTVDP